ncbi:Phosphoglucomutase/phosphomannomutase, alpha/beta/alpha domain III [Flavobacterium gillisiae]|uniref:Phosphoglucomutase/phosphomannomutase, alpha/beta/alpha domain III n=1 Tax=Flavobacterium gillisiae TaxID=150146 RepID=A0A1H4F708_9FLAO|nr:Phosphoglucomutase/phosphomannomutase, alpha/beta/alpha domain III [Flavobacterium gillisiae]
MKKVNAIIGGGGNGGIIYPELHYGRDALVGIGFLLSSLAESNLSLSNLTKTKISIILYVQTQNRPSSSFLNGHYFLEKTRKIPKLSTDNYQ